MKHLANMFAVIVLLFTWLAGLVVASGFWQTTAALFPFYAWYLFVEKMMQQIGCI